MILHYYIILYIRLLYGAGKRCSGVGRQLLLTHNGYERVRRWWCPGRGERGTGVFNRKHIIDLWVGSLKIINRLRKKKKHMRMKYIGNSNNDIGTILL